MLAFTSYIPNIDFTTVPRLLNNLSKEGFYGALAFYENEECIIWFKSFPIDQVEYIIECFKSVRNNYNSNHIHYKIEDKVTVVVICNGKKSNEEAKKKHNLFINIIEESIKYMNSANYLLNLQMLNK